jgi:hypothetical protein
MAQALPVCAGWLAHPLWFRCAASLRAVDTGRVGPKAVREGTKAGTLRVPRRTINTTPISGVVPSPEHLLTVQCDRPGTVSTSSVRCPAQ